jgi:purine-binding chemotaxis protein CheW
MELLKKLEPPAPALNDDAVMILDFLTKDAMSSLESYVTELSKTGKDHQDHGNNRKIYLTPLKQWIDEYRPEQPTQNIQTQKLPDLILLFRNMEKAWGIAANNVVEIVEHHTIEPLPFPRPDIKGLINLRGDPLAIIRCPDFDEQKNNATTQQPIIVIRVDNKTFGLPIDQIKTIRKFNVSDFQTPEIVNQMTKDSWVQTMINHENETVLILDVKKIQHNAASK